MLDPIEVATGAESNFTHISDPSEWKIDHNSSYFHYCQNETVHGFQF
jgi:phosphoserine aminotransferase